MEVLRLSTKRRPRSKGRVLRGPIPSSDSLIARIDGEKANLGDLYSGGVFLLCGGPSVNSLDLGLLDNAGIMTFAFNNTWTLHKPNFWTAGDHASRFLGGRLMDPTITKFVRRSRLNNKIRVKTGPSEFEDQKVRAKDLSNTFVYEVGESLDSVEDFFTPSRAQWGFAKHSKWRGKHRSTFRNTMTIALRLCVHLGFKRIYLLGCDFKMTEDYTYAWGQERTKNAVRNNTRLFKVLSEFYADLRPLLEENGVGVYNCNPDSELEAFPFKDFGEAIDMETTPQDFDGKGWYERKAPPDK